MGKSGLDGEEDGFEVEIGGGVKVFVDWPRPKLLVQINREEVR